MSHAQTAPAASHAAAPAAKPANGKAKARDKAHDASMAFALLLTDWLHGDQHHHDKLMELALGLLDDLSGGPDVKEPDEAQVMAIAAKERLTGMTAWEEHLAEQRQALEQKRGSSAPAKEAKAETATKAN